MSDGRKNNGGHSTKGFAGRKPKADEIAKIEMMDSVAIPEDAWKALWNRCLEKDTNAIKFWIEHRFGKAKERVDVTSGDEPIDSFDYSKLSKEALLEIANLKTIKPSEG